MPNEIWALSPVVAYESRPTVPGGGAGTFRATYMSANAERVLGFPAAAFTTPRATSLLVSRIHPADQGCLLAELDQAFHRRAPAIELTYRFRRGDGREIWLHAVLRAEYDDAGAPRRILGYLSDVSAQRRAADVQRFLADASVALGSSLDRTSGLETLAAHAVPFLADACHVYAVDERGEARRLASAFACEQEAERLRATGPAFARGTHSPPLVAHVIATGEAVFLPGPDDVARATERWARDDAQHDAARSPTVVSAMVVPLIARGRTVGAITLYTTGSARVYTADDLALAEELARRAALAVDNSRLYAESAEARARAEEAESRWRELVAGLDAIVWEGRCQPGHEDEVEFTFVSRRAEQLLGHPVRRWLEDRWFWASIIHPEDRAAVVAQCAAAVRDRRAHALEYRLLAAAGDAVWVRDRVLVDELADGAVRLRGVAVDITEQRRVQEQLRESEERYRLLLNATNEVLFERDFASGRVYFSEALRTVLHTEPPPRDAALSWWWDRVHPADRAALDASLQRVVQSADPRWAAEYRFRRDDGTYAFVAGRGYAELGPDGRLRRLVGSMLDVSEQRRLEEQFRHAQKLEAVGRLAGSIAHDFNNMLTVVRCRGEFLREALAPDSPLREDVTELLGATGRAAQLTSQLLAFSRRQPLEPRLVNVNDVVRGIETMLGQLAGGGVALEVDLEPSLGNVRADPGQLEQVIVNLAVNASDAMPGGGTLTVRTGDVDVREGDAAQVALGAAPGPYVMLQVRDTGAGMDAATRERAFEPFFTTKPPGKGTGLGLSTVYGIVRQSGGVVLLDSAPGAGTTFSVFFPRAEAAAAPAGDARSGAPPG